MSDVVSRCQTALRDICHEAILDLFDDYPERVSLEVSFEALVEVAPGLADDVVTRPEIMLDHFDAALAQYPDPDGAMSQSHVRFVELPEDVTLSVGEERVEHKDRLVAFQGQITKRTDVGPLLQTGVFECLRCGLDSKLSQGFGTIREPFECMGCDTQGPFRLNERISEFEDHQKVRLQQPPEEAVDGATASIDCHLLDDICGTIEGGQRVTLVGQYVAYSHKRRARFRKRFLVNNVIPENADPREVDTSEHAEEIQRIANTPDPLATLVESFAPGHKGDEHVKRAIVLQILGSWARHAPDGTLHRGKSHIFLLGDPGVGKSNLLEAAARLSPRSALTDGTGSSAAGLTAAITKDDFSDEQFSIEAGTLVRANKGVAVVDELDKGDTSDLDALHTALESQEVRVTKAGKNAILPAKTALLAAANPVGGHFDPANEFVDEVELQSPLLSRFDLIFTMREVEDREHVRAIGKHMVESRQTSGELARGDDVDGSKLDAVEPSIEPEAWRAYVIEAQKIQPVIKDEAIRERLIEWFADLKTDLPARYQGEDEEADLDGPPLPVTARMLDAVQRLAEAHARARLSGEVTWSDVEVVTTLVDRSLADIGIAPDSNEVFGTTDGELEFSELGI
ncbi:minichromosome maintenance protein MCM [Haladaptatus sp. ZSTT2]|uniref:minichromosome maintenance protein MCM n=1 Tax=Haladaptatus sp. ZSTT2 TaxID=3120515 RepID=UPI00300EFACA